MLKLSTVVFYVFFFSLFSAFAQQRESAKIIGYIRNSEGSALSGATVYIPNTAYSTQADRDGHFVLLVDAGNYEMIGTALGYVAQKISFSLSSGEVKRYQFALSRDPNTAIEQVVVEGKSAIQEVRETPFNVIALDAKSQYNSTLNLAQLLGKASGVRVRESGGVGSDVNISLNGFTGRHVKIFMDGVPLQTSGSSFQLNNIPVSLAERIEVYKGVVPIEFGADAIGGVINIVTNQTTNSFLDASYSYGSFNTHRTNVILGHTTAKGFSFQVNAYQNYSDNDYRVKARLLNGLSFEPEERWFRRFHDAYRNEGVVGKIGWVNRPWADRFFVGMTWSQEKDEIQTAPSNIEWVYGARENNGNSLIPSLEYYKRNLFTEGLTVRLTGNYTYSQRHNVDTASYRYNWAGEATPSPTQGESAGVNSLADYRNSIYSSTLSINYRIDEKHSVAINDVHSGSQRKADSNLPLDEMTELDRMRRLSLKNVLGLSYRYRHSRNWNLNVFGKNYYQKVIGPFNAGDEAHPDYQERSESYNTSGYGVAGTYFLKDYQFKASIERAYRLPTDNELFGDEIAEAGNASLRAENSMNYNLGATLNRALADNSTLYIDLSGFYRDTRDFIRRMDLARFGGIMNVNHGKVHNIGVDVEARYYYRNKLMLGGVFTYQDMRNKEMLRSATGTALSGQYNDRMPNIPYLFGNADAAYYIHGLGAKENVLNINYTLNYVHEFFLKWESVGGTKLTVPEQLSHDFTTTYSVQNGRYNFTLEAKNFTNAELYDNFSLMKPGRAFYVKFRYYLLKRK